MAKGKPRELKDIKLKEVSFVDKPANQRSFLFFKREHERIVKLLEKAKKIKIEIESDGTANGTKVIINGDDLGELRDFNFNFWKGNDEKSPVACSYSKVVDSEGGFKRTETFHLSKGNNVMDEKTLKALQKYLGVDNVNFEKSDDEEALQKAIVLITKNYKESFPQDLEKAVAVLAKCAVGRIEEKDSIEKAGAKFSKDTIAKLKAIISAAESLKQLIETSSGKKDSTEKAENKDNPEVNKGIEELTKSIEAMKEIVEKKDSKEEEDNPLTKLTKAVEEMSQRLQKVEKGGTLKKGIEGQDGDDDEVIEKGAGDNGEILWPSFKS
jgi:hypothetical protein